MSVLMFVSGCAFFSTDDVAPVASETPSQTPAAEDLDSPYRESSEVGATTFGEEVGTRRGFELTTSTESTSRPASAVYTSTTAIPRTATTGVLEFLRDEDERIRVDPFEDIPQTVTTLALSREQYEIVEFATRYMVEDVYRIEFAFTSWKSAAAFAADEQCFRWEWAEVFLTPGGYPIAEALHAKLQLHPEMTAARSAHKREIYYRRDAQKFYDREEAKGVQNLDAHPYYLRLTEEADQAEAEANRLYERAAQFVNGTPIEKVDMDELTERYNYYDNLVDSLFETFFEEDRSADLMMLHPDSCFNYHSFELVIN